MIRRSVAAAVVVLFASGCLTQETAAPATASVATATAAAPAPTPRSSELLPLAHQSEAVTAFTEMLDRRLAAQKSPKADPAEIAKIDEAVRARFEKPLGVMITDMSGMTELTKQRGIIGILALIREMQAITVPIVKKRGGTWVKMEADDLFVTHASAKELFLTGREMLAGIEAHATETKDDSIKMGIGLGWGKVLDLGDDIWGDAVNTASKLGEDSAEPGEILMSEDFHARLLAEGETPADCKLVAPAARKAKFPYYVCK